MGQEQAKLTQEERQALTAEVNRIWKEAQRYDAEGKAKEAMAAGEKTLSAAQRLLGNDHSQIGSLLEWLAERYERLDDFVAAKRARTSALEHKIKRLGQDHWESVDARLALSNTSLLAQLTSDQRRQLKSAREKNRDAIGLYREGKYVKAMNAANEAMEVRKGILGKDHRDYAQSLNNMAFLYRSRGDHAKAEPLYRQMLEIKKKLLGDAHPDYAIALNDVARMHQSKGDSRSIERQRTYLRKPSETHIPITL
jgi:tetratricopeptide (TPR) repeat protein